jgi:hypothetical protein
MKVAIAALAVLGAQAACGGASPAPTTPSTSTGTSTSTPTSTGTPTPTSTGTLTPPPPATGGSILIGDIASAKSFDPKATLLSIQQQLLDCYNKARGANAELRGKLKLRLVVNDAGTVVNADAEPGGLSAEEGLVSCLGGVARATHFPKPGGMATVTVPMLFRP